MLCARRRMLSRGRRRSSRDVRSVCARAPRHVALRDVALRHVALQHLARRHVAFAPSTQHQAPSTSSSDDLLPRSRCVVRRVAGRVGCDRARVFAACRVARRRPGVRRVGTDARPGTAGRIAREVHRLGTDRGLTLRVAIARTTTPAWLLAHARAGTTVVSAEHTATALAGLPLRWLATMPDEWILGCRIVTPSAAPPEKTARPSARHYRMAPGPVVQKTAAAATGRTPRSRERVRATIRASRICWPRSRDGGSSRSAIWRGCRAPTCARGRTGRRAAASGRVGRGRHGARARRRGAAVRRSHGARLATRCARAVVVRAGADPSTDCRPRLSAHRGAVEVTTRLQLVTRELHVRVLHLPAPIRSADAPHADPARSGSASASGRRGRRRDQLGVVPGRIVQGSLLTRTLPTPEDLATLTARLFALMLHPRRGAEARRHARRSRRLAREICARDADAGSGRRRPRTPALRVGRPGPGTCVRRFWSPGHRARDGRSRRAVTRGAVSLRTGLWRRRRLRRPVAMIRALVEASTDRSGTAMNGTSSSPAVIATGSRAIA